MLSAKYLVFSSIVIVSVVSPALPAVILPGVKVSPSVRTTLVAGLTVAISVFAIAYLYDASEFQETESSCGSVLQIRLMSSVFLNLTAHLLILSSYSIVVAFQSRVSAMST